MEPKQYTDNQIREHMHDGNQSQAIHALDIFDLRRFIQRIVVPSDTAVATGTTIAGDLVMPFGGTVVEVGATVDTAGTTGTMSLGINKNGSTILSTDITLDSTEKTSRTAVTPAIVSDTVFKTGDIFTFDVDTVQTTPAMGLTFFMTVIITTY